MKKIKAPRYPELLPVFGNPWKTQGSSEIYKNPWISLREDRVITPKGKDGIYSVIDTRIATAVVALDENDNVYLVGQYRYPTKQYSWEVIEGGSEGQQNALTTAQRELKEEAGLEAADWLQLGEEFHLSNCFSSEVAFVFLARNLTEVVSDPDETEDLVVTTIPFTELVMRANSGEIKDALSLIAIGRAERYLKNSF